jgi:hypothetical protein
MLGKRVLVVVSTVVLAFLLLGSTFLTNERDGPLPPALSQGAVATPLTEDHSAPPSIPLPLATDPEPTTKSVDLKPSLASSTKPDDTPRTLSVRRVDHTNRDTDVPHGGTLTLEKPVLPKPPMSQRTPPKICPKRWIFVNTHTFGRHHNQLQEFMNLIAWSERLQRTVVLGWFRHNHKWSDPSEFYNFSAIAERYCVVSPQQFQQQLKSTGAEKVVAQCYGQRVEDTPLKRFGVKCSMVPGIGAHYNVRHGMNITAGIFQKLVENQSPFIVVSGQIAFFLRPGLRTYAEIFSLLQPSDEILEEVRQFSRRALWSTSGNKPLPYFGVHLRQREKECMKEVHESFEDGMRELGHLTASDRTVIATQCAMTVAHVKSLQQSLGFVPSSTSVDGVVFLASDHENMVLEKALVDAGAIMYSGGKYHTKELGGLKGLAVDFFLLVEGAYFTGNQLSSVTQNVCYMRLGRGKPCHGFIREFTLYHARSVEGQGMDPPPPLAE